MEGKEFVHVVRETAREGDRLKPVRTLCLRVTKGAGELQGLTRGFGLIREQRGTRTALLESSGDYFFFPSPVTSRYQNG
jgi:myo-inositol catabolism protein IolC